MKTWIPALLAALAAFGAAGDDEAFEPRDALRSKDPAQRLEAVAFLSEGGHEDAEKLLLRALDDDDWEVVQRAAQALGTVGGEDSVKDLVRLAWDAPIARIRYAAARSVARIDAEEALEDVGKRAKRDTALAACESLARIAPHAEDREVPRAVERLLDTEDDPRLAAAAARATVLCSQSRVDVIAVLLDDDRLGIRAAAAEAAALAPSPEYLPYLHEFLRAGDLDPTVERRLVTALLASCAAGDDPTAAALADLEALTKVDGGRAARLLRGLARREWRDADRTAEAIDGLLAHEDAGVRALALRARTELGGDGARAAALTLAEDDPSARVRRQALRALTALGVADEDETIALLTGRLAEDDDAGARELAAVALALPEDESVVVPLTEALDDPDWGVVACAAVSLGTTRMPDARAPLEALAEHDDWRRRGAAVVGLGKLYDRDAIPAVIARLADEEPAVARTAHAWLEAVSKQTIAADDLGAWSEWYRENRDRLRLYDPKELAERREKYGYVIDPAQVFRGLDVLVFQSRGDHIEDLLAHLEIDHRLTRSSNVAEAGLDAAGVFVSNCTGEMLEEDVERLQWFVRVGGYLFGSCWALSETIERVAPGPVARQTTNGEVLDDVLAQPVVEGSAYLEGVFEEGVTPIYHLEGAHLIEVHEPEHVEVLVDSPECAERWGGGELACWFRLGHGVLLDSTNHFDLQGLALATHLQDPEERMAFAMDHMGVDHATIRATRRERWWGSNTKAAKQVKDLSTLELVANFVRLRRVEGR